MLFYSPFGPYELIWMNSSQQFQIAFEMRSAKYRLLCSNHTVLTHWGRVTHICVSRLTITGSDNGLSPGWRQAIIWTNAGILLIGPLGTNFSEILIGIYTFSFKKMHFKMSSGKWRPFCLGLDVLTLMYWKYPKERNTMETSIIRRSVVVIRKPVPGQPCFVDLDTLQGYGCPGALADEGRAMFGCVHLIQAKELNYFR